jgi:predicted nucleic acid-binding protein
MSIVSDTTAITTLLKAGRIRLLADLFQEILLPAAVWDELKAFHSELPDFLKLRPVNSSQRLPGTELLGRGEAEALLLATELGAKLLVTDDRKARTAARQLRIPCVGSLGIVVQAKQLGMIPSARELIGVLETKGGLYLSDAVKAEALRLTNEN